MSELLHANIFFFIASVASVIFVVLVSIALYLVIKILQSIRRIVARIEEGSEVIADDFESMRTFIFEGGLISRIIGAIIGMKSKRRTRHTNDD